MRAPVIWSDNPPTETSKLQISLPGLRFNFQLETLQVHWGQMRSWKYCLCPNNVLDELLKHSESKILLSYYMMYFIKRVKIIPWLSLIITQRICPNKDTQKNCLYIGFESPWNSWLVFRTGAFKMSTKTSSSCLDFYSAGDPLLFVCLSAAHLSN